MRQKDRSWTRIKDGEETGVEGGVGAGGVGGGHRSKKVRQR